MNTKTVSQNVLLGIDSFNHGAFFEAHEFLENAWRNSPPETRLLYQTLVQISAACHHLQQRNLKGAYLLFTRALAYLEPFLDSDTGIDLVKFSQEISQLTQTVEKHLQHPSLNYAMPEFPHISFVSLSG